MWILSILGLLLAAFLLKRRFKIGFYMALPAATAIMILILYILAFFSALKYIDLLALLEILAFGIYVERRSKQAKEEIRKDLLDFIKMPELWSVLAVCVLTTVLTIGQIVTWWDDLNYWATDLKALYYMNGFAGKYGNVAPEFGDYPPATQLFKWWFLHFSGTYVEGLQFAGYYCMNFIFLLPVIKDIKSKNFFVQLVSCIVITVIPSIVDRFWAYGTCADVTMGILYGAILLELYRARNKKGNIYFQTIYMAALLAVLVLVKTVAVEWAAFAVIFGIAFGAFTMAPFKKKAANEGVSAIALLLPIFTEGSWMLFCLLNRRVAKLTSAGVKMAAGGNYSLPGDAMERINAYFTGFWKVAMHENNTFSIDLSAGAFLIVVLAVIVLFSLIHTIDKKETVKLFIFTLITAFAAYGIILIGHLTIFQTENQYLEAETMAKSIERYGAPFSLGFIMLLAGIALTIDISKRYIISVLLAIAAVLFADHGSIYMAYGGYYADRADQLSARSDMIGDVESTFLEAIEGKEELAGSRVLCIQDATDIHWVRNTYTNFYAAPVPVVYSSIYAEQLSAQSIMDLISTMHGSYIYIQDMDADIESLMQEYMLDGESFKYNTVYEIVTDEGKTYFRII
ncbi:MAG: hypothetical protein K5900_01365 [Butyrivibrio sp.]|nr:hypothetical protein [Butyrivibrio sp.]